LGGNVITQINIFVREIYLKFFYDLINDQKKTFGFVMPEFIEWHVATLLADRVEKTDIIPDPSFAEKYLSLYLNPKPEEILSYADDCLFFTSLMPEYGKKRGLNMDYYATLGISSYYAYGDLIKESFYTQIGNYFYYLQKFINSTIKNKNSLDFFDQI
jgi:hypothetical protein